MSIRGNTSIGSNPESNGLELTEINKAIQGMYSTEVAKLIPRMNGAKPEVTEVMTGVIVGDYVLRILKNQQKFSVSAANDGIYSEAA